MMKELLPTLLVLIVACSLSFVAGHYIGSHDPIPFLLGGTSAVGVEHSSGDLIGQPLLVKRIRVVEGHVFDIVLDSGDRYLVRLDGVSGTPAEAKTRVLRLLNEHRQLEHSLTVVLRQWDADKDQWIATLYYNGQDSLSDWLSSQNLVYR